MHRVLGPAGLALRRGNVTPGYVCRDCRLRAIHVTNIRWAEQPSDKGGDAPASAKPNRAERNKAALSNIRALYAQGKPDDGVEASQSHKKGASAPGETSEPMTHSEQAASPMFKHTRSNASASNDSDIIQSAGMAPTDLKERLRLRAEERRQQANVEENQEREDEEDLGTGELDIGDFNATSDLTSAQNPLLPTGQADDGQSADELKELFETSGDLAKDIRWLFPEEKDAEYADEEHKEIIQMKRAAVTAQRAGYILDKIKYIRRGPYDPGAENFDEHMLHRDPFTYEPPSAEELKQDLATSSWNTCSTGSAESRAKVIGERIDIAKRILKAIAQGGHTRSRIQFSSPQMKEEVTALVRWIRNERSEDRKGRKTNWLDVPATLQWIKEGLPQDAPVIRSMNARLVEGDLSVGKQQMGRRVSDEGNVVKKYNSPVAEHVAQMMRRNERVSLAQGNVIIDEVMRVVGDEPPSQTV